ncbi:hypothetical protein DEA98_14330 [Brucella pseudogrignonensis]|nr:hypothetical protein [Brucella pseudogrignonensis]
MHKLLTGQVDTLARKSADDGPTMMLIRRDGFTDTSSTSANGFAVGALPDTTFSMGTSFSGLKSARYSIR